MSTPFTLLLPAQLYKDMIQQAQTELPNECCGLLAGILDTTGPTPLARIERRYPLINAAASATEFLSEPESMFRAERDMRKNGLETLAIYHSHPNSESIPSLRDLERNYSCEVMNMIISLLTDPPVVEAWWLNSSAYDPARWEVIDNA